MAEAGFHGLLAPPCARWRSRPTSASSTSSSPSSTASSSTTSSEDKVTRVARLPIPDEDRGAPARAVPARLRPPRPGDRPDGREALRRRARCPTTARSSTARRSRRRSSRRRSPSRTGRPTARDGKLLLRLGLAATTRSPSSTTRPRRSCTQFPVGFHPQRVRNGVVRVAQYPQGKHGEPFRLRHVPRARADRRHAAATRTSAAARPAPRRCASCAASCSCARDSARGRQAGRDRLGRAVRVAAARAFKVDVDLNAAGHALLAHAAEGLPRHARRARHRLDRPQAQRHEARRPAPRRALSTRPHAPSRRFFAHATKKHRFGPCARRLPWPSCRPSRAPCHQRRAPCPRRRSGGRRGPPRPVGHELVGGVVEVDEAAF